MINRRDPGRAAILRARRDENTQEPWGGQPTLRSCQKACSLRWTLALDVVRSHRLNRPILILKGVEP